MTNIFVRIQRNGVWDAFDIDELTQAELEEFFRDRSKEDVLKFFAAVTNWMQKNIRVMPGDSISLSE